VYVAVACFVHRRFPRIFTVGFLSPTTCHAVGIVLAAAGVCLYAWALASLRSARRTGSLATTGPYGRVRHPIHAAWMGLIVPGIALALRSWSLLATPLVYYAAFRALIQSEEAALLERFGSAYGAYRLRTNLVFPLRRARSRR